MDRRPTRFPPRPRLNLDRHANEPNSQSSSKSSTSARPVEEQKPDPKDDIVERDAEGNYLISAGDPSIIPDKIPEIEVWTDEDADPEEVKEREAALIELFGKEAYAKQKAEFEPAALAEIQTALNNSLEKIYDSLDDDKWIFEGGDPKPKLKPEP